MNGDCSIIINKHVKDSEHEMRHLYLDHSRKMKLPQSLIQKPNQIREHRGQKLETHTVSPVKTKQ